MSTVLSASPREAALPLDRMAGQAGHIPGLDGLRAISIVVVLLSHYVNANLFPGGLGVYVFFVISGFLITRLLFAEAKLRGSPSLPKFYLRRIVRLYPAALAFVAVVMALSAWRGQSVDPMGPLSALFYFANYHYLGTEAPHGHFRIFWSLSVEEHFYVLLPVAVVLIKRADWLLWGMGAVCLGCLACRLAEGLHVPQHLRDHWLTWRTEYRLDSMAYGVAVSCLCELERGRRFLRAASNPAWAAMALMGILACLLIRDDFFRGTLRYSILGGSLAVLLAFVMFRPTRLLAVLESAPLRFIGLISYSLYLWHYLIPWFFEGWTAPVWQTAPVFTVAAIALATASYFGLERPLIHLRARLQARAADGSGRRMTDGGDALAPGPAVESSFTSS